MRNMEHMEKWPGTKHDFLGMIVEFADGELTIDTIECTEKMLQEFLIKFKKTRRGLTLAGMDSFKEDFSEKLCQGKGNVSIFCGQVQIVGKWASVEVICEWKWVCKKRNHEWKCMWMKMLMNVIELSHVGDDFVKIWVFEWAIGKQNQSWLTWAMWRCNGVESS